MKQTSQLFLGDCLDSLKKLPDNSVDSIVTDPPYGLSFMGKKWDYDVPSEEIWREALRVLKPGGHLLSFFGTRTYHRGVIKIEDAGFEIRDQIMWIYGSGFPKSTDVSKRIDKEAGAIREVLGTKDGDPNIKGNNFNNDDGTRNIQSITAPSTNEAKQWQGWGSALKPANEPIVVARKPLEKGLTLAQNVLKYGTGGINIDETRISMTDEDRAAVQAKANKKDTTNNIISGFGNNTATHGDWSMSKGRWPANILFDEEAAAALDEQSGFSSEKSRICKIKPNDSIGTFKTKARETVIHGGSGGASRFFYVAKASKSERNKGLEGEVKAKQGARPKSADASGKFPDHDHRETGGNNHPTVKPIKLMEYLIKLVTPPQGTVLDPFMGSGSTGVAAKQLGFDFIGCEMSEEYLAIAEKRIG